MHPRNPYQSPPDFAALASAYPPLQPHIIRTCTGATIDFKSETAQRALTEAILWRDFSVRISLPPARLCPPIPNRLNYILWLQDVVDTVSLALGQEPSRPVRGLDIGTGASAIYPLLGCQSRQNWSFVGTEIDLLSLQSARSNLQTNGLEDRISIRAADPAGPIFAPLLEQDGTVYDFTMCNPPFYTSREEVQQSAEAKELGPNAVCTGADVEMITLGGEASFVKCMVDESLDPLVHERCRWFTSMLGKLSSLTHIVQALRDNKVDNYAIAELVQGQTRRWVIAWSFADLCLPDSLARISHHSTHALMPARNTLHQPLSVPSLKHASTIARTVLATIEGLRVVPTPAHTPSATAPSSTETSDVPSSSPLDVIASTTAGDTWSRAARRKKRSAMDVEPSPSSFPKLVCRIRCRMRPADGEKSKGDGVDGGVELVFDWLRGRERGLFESFASHVERKVVAALGSGVALASGGSVG
ncbi:hypothetical protein C8Q77DRAFT_1055507 [Trametes polyzona]|nr:hypothetical protein C8Q77DRAFT_1055507 [Trametes polyzona]